MAKDLLINSQVKLIHICKIDDSVIVGIKTVLSDENVYRYLPFNSPPDKNEVTSFLNRIISLKSIIWGITYNSEFIGIIDLINIENGSANLAYFLAVQYQGRGIVTAAINSVTRFAFNELKLSEIYAPVVSRNTASKRVLEKNHFSFHKNSGKKVDFDGIDDEVQLYVLTKPI